MGYETGTDSLQSDGTTSAIASRRNCIRDGSHRSVIVFDKIEINRLRMLRCTNDTEAIASKRLRVELQADIHILTCGSAETLASSFSGVNLEGEYHITIFSF